MTDLVLPQMNGRDLAEKLTLLRPAIWVLFMSGYSPEAIDRGIVTGDLAYLRKPFSPEELKTKVRKALTRSRATGLGDQ